MLDGNISERFSTFEVVLKEVEERDVVGSHGHHDFVLLFEAFETLDGLIDLFVLNIMDGFCDFHFALNFWKVGGFESFADVIITIDNVLIDEWGNELSSQRNVVKSLLFFAFKILLKRISLGNIGIILVLHLKKLLLLFLIHTWNGYH